MRRLLPLLLVALLPACGYTASYTTTVAADGSGVLTVGFAAAEETIIELADEDTTPEEALADFRDEIDLEITGPDSEVQQFPPGTELERWEPDGHIGVLATAPFASPEEFDELALAVAAVFTQDDGITGNPYPLVERWSLAPTDSGGYRVEMQMSPPAGEDGQPARSEEELPVTGITRVQVTLPGEVVSHDGLLREPDTVVWEHQYEDLVLDGGAQMHAESGPAREAPVELLPSETPQPTEAPTVPAAPDQDPPPPPPVPEVTVPEVLQLPDDPEPASTPLWPIAAFLAIALGAGIGAAVMWRR